MDQARFKVGDQVELKSGGPTMTVTGYVYNGNVDAKWFSGGKLSSGEFPSGSLQLAEPPSPPKAKK